MRNRKRIDFDAVPMDVKHKKRKVSVSSTDSSTGSTTINNMSPPKKVKCKKVNMNCQTTPKGRPKWDYKEIDKILSECEMELNLKPRKLNQSLPSKLSKATKKSKFLIIESSDSDVNVPNIRTPQRSIDCADTAQLGIDMQTSNASSKDKLSKKKSNKNKKEDFQNLLKIINNDFTEEKQKCESVKSTSKRKRTISFNDALQTDSEEPVISNKKKKVKRSIAENNEEQKAITEGNDESMINIKDVVTVNQKDLTAKKSVKGKKCLKKVNKDLAINPKEQDDTLTIKKSTGSVKEVNQLYKNKLDKSHSFDDISDKYQEIQPSIKRKAVEENSKCAVKKSTKKQKKHKNDIESDGLELEIEKSFNSTKYEIVNKPKKSVKDTQFKSTKEPINAKKDHQRLKNEDEELANAKELDDSNIVMKKESPKSRVQMLNVAKNLQKVNTKDDKILKKKRILIHSNIIVDEELNVSDSINQQKIVDATIRSLNESMKIKNEYINEHDLHHELIIKQSPDSSASRMDSDNYIDNEDEQLPITRSAIPDSSALRMDSDNYINNEDEQLPITRSAIPDSSASRMDSDNYIDNEDEQLPITRSAIPDSSASRMDSDNYINNEDKQLPITRSTIHVDMDEINIDESNQKTNFEKTTRSTIPSEGSKTLRCKKNEEDIFPKPHTPQTMNSNSADVKQQLPISNLNLSLYDEELNSSLVIKSFNRKSYLETKISRSRQDEVSHLDETKLDTINFDPIEDVAHTSTENTNVNILSKIVDSEPKPSINSNEDISSDEDEVSPDSGNQSTLNKKYAGLDSIYEDFVKSITNCKLKTKENSNKKVLYLGRKDLARVHKYYEQGKLVKNVEKGCKAKHNVKNVSFDTQKMMVEAVRSAIIERDWDSIPYLLSYAIETGNHYFSRYISEMLMTYLMVRKNEAGNKEMLELLLETIFKEKTNKKKEIRIKK